MRGSAPIGLKMARPIFRLDDHTNRLFNSAHILNLSIPCDKATINKVCRDVVKRNRLDRAYIRPMCFYGAEGMGLHVSNLNVHVMVAAWAWGSYLGSDG